MSLLLVYFIRIEHSYGNIDLWPYSLVRQQFVSDIVRLYECSTLASKTEHIGKLLQYYFTFGIIKLLHLKHNISSVKSEHAIWLATTRS